MELEYSVVDREHTVFGELVLRRFVAEHGEEGYEILLDGAFLMASHGASSERAMAALAHQRLAGGRRDLEVLVGGLGAGHTLRAALDLEGVGRVVVAEIGHRVGAWNRRYFAPFNRGAVDDPRVEVRIGDVRGVMHDSRKAFDIVLLDVDNGPGWLASAANAPLYEITGAETCRRCLRPGGVLAVWSPRPNPVFRSTLETTFEQVEEVDTTVASRRQGEPASTIYLAR